MAQKTVLKAVDLFQADGEGKVTVVWIMSTNSYGEFTRIRAQVRRALEKCELVIGQ